MRHVSLYDKRDIQHAILSFSLPAKTCSVYFKPIYIISLGAGKFKAYQGVKLGISPVPHLGNVITNQKRTARPLNSLDRPIRLSSHSSLTFSILML
jgi:hypothetical protein